MRSGKTTDSSPSISIFITIFEFNGRLVRIRETLNSFVNTFVFWVMCWEIRPAVHALLFFPFMNNSFLYKLLIPSRTEANPILIVTNRPLDAWYFSSLLNLDAWSGFGSNPITHTVSRFQPKASVNILWTFDLHEGLNNFSICHPMFVPRSTWKFWHAKEDTADIMNGKIWKHLCFL